MSNETEDQQWLDALSGKSADKSNVSAVEREAMLIRSALILKSKTQEVFEPSTDGLRRLMVEARRQGLLHPKVSSRGSALERLYNFLGVPVGAPASALAFPTIGLASIMLVLAGVAIGWQVTSMRTSEVTHSVDDVSRGTGLITAYESVNHGPPKIILITTKDSEKYAGKVISVAWEAGLEVVSQKSGEKISLIMSPFRPNSNEQVKIRELLKLQPDIRGSVNVIISKGK